MRFKIYKFGGSWKDSCGRLEHLDEGVNFSSIIDCLRCGYLGTEDAKIQLKILIIVLIELEGGSVSAKALLGFHSMKILNADSGTDNSHLFDISSST